MRNILEEIDTLVNVKRPIVNYSPNPI